MANLPTEILRSRRVMLLREIDTLNVRVDEIDKLLNLAGDSAPISPTMRLDRDPPEGWDKPVSITESGFRSITIVKARNPRKIKK
jgi:hypothetical protein